MPLCDGIELLPTPGDVCVSEQRRAIVGASESLDAARLVGVCLCVCVCCASRSAAVEAQAMLMSGVDVNGTTNAIVCCRAKCEIC